MKNRSRRLWRFALPAAALALAGCAGAVYLPPPVVDSLAARESLSQSLERRYPPQCRIVQRIALRAGGKQYDLIGYLMIDGDSFRALALGEMSGKILELSLEHGRSVILKKPEGMPSSPLLAGAIEDIRHLFLPPAGQDLAAAGSAARPSALTGTAADGRTVTYLFNVPDRQLTNSIETKAGDILRRVRYSDYRILKSVGSPVPTNIFLENLRFHYTMEIQIIEIIPGPAARRDSGGD